MHFANSASGALRRSPLWEALMHIHSVENWTHKHVFWARGTIATNGACGPWLA
jgi:hypothetical protein